MRDTLHAVLGHRGPHAIDSRSTFKDLGVDSLTALELRRQLGTATGLRLPATLVFETPTPGDLARRLRRELTQLTPDPGPSTHTGSGPLDEPIAIVSMACRYPGG